MRQAIGKIVTVPQTLAFPISPQAIRVSNYNKPVQMVILEVPMKNWRIFKMK